jgi:hypothetical protein
MATGWLFMYGAAPAPLRAVGGLTTGKVRPYGVRILRLAR